MSRSFFLSPQKAKIIHNASLRVLEQTGFKLEHKEALDLLLSSGATKDSENRILIPRKLVNETLEKTKNKSHFKLYNRDGNKPLSIKAGNTHFGTGSDALYNIDLDTLKRRKSVLSDVANNVQIADSLSGFQFVMSMALPGDVTEKELYPAVFAEIIKNTDKPLVTTATNVDDLKWIHKIASVVTENKLKDKPFFVAYLEPISPLIMNDSSVERLLFCAEKNIPMMYAAGANCGTGAPVTSEGGVVQGSAESLGGLVLASLKNENVRFLYGANTSVMDMRTTIVCYGDPIWFKTTAMYADMGKFYNLPSWGTAGSSDSFTLDAQAAMEAYEGILLAQQSGTTLAHDVGYLAHGELYDARMLILTDMMINRARHILREPDLTEENMSVDVINEVARSGDLYLTHMHTARKFKKSLWLAPKYINRKHFNSKSFHDLEELLTTEVNNIRKNHKSKRLKPEKEKKVQQILDSI